ncbi:hypothetical protein MYIN104542_30480 [Mycobacterium intermedium]
MGSSGLLMVMTGSCIELICRPGKVKEPIAPRVTLPRDIWPTSLM